MDGGKPMGAYASCVPATTGPEGPTCVAFPLPDGGSASTVCAADTENGVSWSSVGSCALPELTGCCGRYGTWQCYYNDEIVLGANPKNVCLAEDGTWITTAP
jgi:hypothetical protein